jgi:hypothetical protein
VSALTFNCPYCWLDVPAQATVCGHCTRDLVLFKPLALQLQAVSQEVEQLESSLAQQAQALAQMQSQDVQSAALSFAGSLPQAALADQTPTRAPSWLMLITVAVLTIPLIGLCHWLLLFVYDAQPLFLRVLTIALPALTGYVCARQSGLGWVAQFLAAMVVAVVSVVLMLGITAHIDTVPLWPNNTRDWRETLEYTAAIGLGFFTGYLMLRLVTLWNQKQSNIINLRVLLERDEKGQFKIAEISNQVQSLMTATAPLVSTGVALYSGLKAFAGA